MPVLTITFPGGVDESVYGPLVDPASKLTQQHNAFQDSRGSLQKPLGNRSLTVTRTDTTTMSVGYSMFAYRDTFGVIDGHRINTYAETPGRWVLGDRLPEASITRIPLPLSGDIWAADTIVCNGYLFAVAMLMNGAGTALDLYAATMDATTYEVIDVTRLATGLTITAAPEYDVARLATDGTNVWVAYVTAANNIEMQARVTTTISSGGGWTGPSGAPITDWDTGSSWGCDSFNTRLVIAYINTSGGANSLTLKTFDAGPLLDLTQTIAAPAGSTAATVLVDAANVLWVAYYDPGATLHRMIARTTALAALYTVGSIITTAGGTQGLSIVKTGTTTGILVSGSQQITAHNFTVTAGALAAAGTERVWYWLHHGARPFVYDGQYYVNAIQSSAPYNTALPQVHVLIDIGDSTSQTTVRPVAYINKGLGATPFSRGQMPSKDMKYAALSGTKFGVLNMSRRNGSTFGLDLAIADFGFSGRWVTAAAGTSIYFSAGCVYYFDGSATRELNFLQGPSQPQITTSGTGITFATGVRYVGIYEAFDDQGNVEWSSVSTPSTATGAVANKTVNVRFDSYAVTSKYNTSKLRATRIAVYRTDDNGGIGPYYRVGTIENATAASTLSYADTVLTATVLTNAQLYKNPGVVGTALDREAPPASLDLFIHGDRLVVLAEDGRSVFFSGPQVEGEQLWFNSAQQFPIAGASRNTAGWSQSGRMVVANESELYAIDGDGPPENGGNGTEFSQPRRISSDVGCIDPRSVCSTAVGTFFQSRRGIELLDLSFNVTWIGEPIVSTMATYPIVTSAVLDAEKSLVIFTIVASETNQQVSGGGVMVVFDLATKSWFTKDTHASGWQSACMATVSGKPRYHALGTSALVYRERLASETGSYLLNTATWRTSQATTGWFKLAGLSGNAIIRKVQLLGKRLTDHDLTVEVGFNDQPAWSQTRTYTRAQIATSTAAGEHLEIVIGNEARARTVRFRLTDVTPTGGTVGTGQGAIWYGLLVHYDLDGSEPFRRNSNAR